jgi:hypothetical protein
MLTPYNRMGELEPWMDENFIKGVFLSSAGETVNVKVIRDKNSGYVQCTLCLDWPCFIRPAILTATRTVMPATVSWSSRTLMPPTRHSVLMAVLSRIVLASSSLTGRLAVALWTDGKCSFMPRA